jgi:DNA-binding LytR/AlgR family response regulator
MQPPCKAIIADDEQALRSSLRLQLTHLWPELEICAEAENGFQALDLIRIHEPQIAFLDIKMPGLSGMEVAFKAAGRCHIVFITAFDQFAVQAFENAAVDYLLKPVEPGRLMQTMQRLKERLANAALLPDGIAKVLKSLQSTLAQAQGYLKWLKVMDRESIRLIAVEDVFCFQAQDKYTVVRTASGEYLIRKPIKELVESLDPEIFWQIHRGTIVNAAKIDQVERSLTGRYVLTLKQIDDTFIVSRSFRDRFKSM